MTRVLPRIPSRRATRRGLVVSTAGALVLAATLVWQSAYAGFTDQTATLTATAGSATVQLTNDVEGVAMALTLDQLRPGEGGSQCVEVTSTGSVPALVKLYAENRTGGSTLLSQLTFSWSAGTGGGGNGSCAGYTPSGSAYNTTMSSFPVTYDSGALPWTTTGSPAGESRTYQLTYKLADGAPASVKGTSAKITFVWEAVNT